MKKDSINMCEGPLLKNIVIYSIPILLTSILQLLFNAADLVVVGRFCGSVSVAAVGATGSISMLMINMFIGLSVGAGVSVAHGIGSGNDNEVKRVIHTAIPTAFLCGAMLTLLGVGFASPLLRLMGTPDDVIGLSSVYMRIYFCGMIPSMIYNFGASILRAAGDTRGPLIYLMISGIINVIMNVFFVVCLKMDVAGVALATVISLVISAILTTAALMRRKDACRFIFKKMKIYKEPLKKIIKIGLPAGLQGAMFSISNVIIQSSINSFGSVVMSGNAAAANIECFLYMASNCFAQSALNFVGQNVGAKNYDRVRRIVRVCLLCVLCTGVFVSTLARLLGRSLLSIYITDSEEAITYGLLRITFCSIFCFVNDLMDVMTNTIRSMGSSLTPMLISVLGICGVRMLWIFTVFQIPAFHTITSIYLSYPLSWVLSFAGEFLAYRYIFKKHTLIHETVSAQ